MLYEEELPKSKPDAHEHALDDVNARTRTIGTMHDTLTLDETLQVVMQAFPTAQTQNHKLAVWRTFPHNPPRIYLLLHAAPNVSIEVEAPFETLGAYASTILFDRRKYIVVRTRAQALGEIHSFLSSKRP